MNPVRRWLDALASVEPAVDHLSPEGARWALREALAQLDDVESTFGAPAPESVAFIAAGTVFTAPLEWLAVLLGRGAKVLLKSPEPLLPWFEQIASLTDLPLEVTTDRARVHEADRVIAMGSDDTIGTLTDELGDRLLGFGSRYSVAWWTAPSRVGALAEDLCLHDGRGCMSPVAIFSPLPDAADRLHAALTALGERIPRGALAPIEGARIRERLALARVLGTVRQGPDHAVLTLPRERMQLDGLPRIAVVHACPDVDTFMASLSDPRISVIGADEPLSTPHRTVPLGQMQRPPLRRLHDGVDWLRAIERS